MLVFQGENISSDENLWSLSPGGNWEPLDLHDDLRTENFVCEYFASTNLQDKILTCLRAVDEEDYLYSFDSKTKQWKLMDISLCGSWVHKLHGGCVMTSFPYSCWSNHRVILSWETKESEDPDSTSGTMFIQAYMVNEENLATIYYQPLWECFEGIQHPSLFELSRISVDFVDLGNNTICALVHEITYEDYKTALIWVSIFKISPLGVGLAETPLVIGSGHSLQKERKFLSVDVIVKRVFYMKKFDNQPWYPPNLSCFVFHSKMDLQTCFPFGGEEANQSSP